MARDMNSLGNPCRPWLAALCSASTLLAACAPHDGGTWDPRSAAAYLDQREQWWAGWPKAARDQGTFCISCHTALPYALARSALRSVLAEAGPSAAERQLLEDVRERVRRWSQMQPYYGGNMAAASRGTESVLNALILADADARAGRRSADSSAAFAAMWALQQTSGSDAGAWNWIGFDNEPWEAYDSDYYGATLAALAVGIAPEDYRSRPEIQDSLERLRQYLSRHYDAQTPLNRIALLMASARLPGLLDRAQRERLIDDIWVRQRADGGWSAATLVGDWKFEDGSALAARSDGYATGLVEITLTQVGVDRADARLARGLTWLAANQSRWNGHWSGYSLNRRHRSLLSKASWFMDDAATAYAVLALSGQAPGGVGAPGAQLTRN